VNAEKKHFDPKYSIGIAVIGFIEEYKINMILQASIY
jgi:hypothetical protein